MLPRQIKWVKEKGVENLSEQILSKRQGGNNESYGSPERFFSLFVKYH